MSKLRHRESWYSRTKKELEEMDYKEKYEKALEWMKSIYPTMQGSDKEDAEHYFPELAESEDERIRKELIELVRELSEEPGRGGLTVRKTEMYISYLEKQKEQIPYIDFVIKPHKGDDNNPYDMGVSEAQEYAIKRGFGIPFNDGEVYVDERHMTQTIGNILRWADEHPIEQKDYRELYKGVSQSEWFKKAYVGKSLGEEDEQNEAEFREGYLHGFEDGQKEQKPRWEINNPYTTKWTKEMIDEKFEELVGQEPAELTPLATLLSNYLKNDFEYFATRQWDEKKWNEIMSIQASELLRYAKKELEKEQKPADGKELLYVSNKSYNIGYRDGKRAAESKQEWSEEDEEMRVLAFRIVNCFKNGLCFVGEENNKETEKVVSWLKSLRPTHWKPSEEQMDALKSKLPIIKGTGNNVDSILESLYNDLKKL